MSPLRVLAPVVVLTFASVSAAAPGRVPSVHAVGCIALTVSDLQRSLAFYERVLTFRRELVEDAAGAPWERLAGVPGLHTRTARVRLGAECLELVEYLAPRDGQPAPADARSNDRWFQHVALVVADMDRAYARLREARVAHVSPGPQRLPDWNPAAGGIRAFYFHDPDAHVLEVIQFPPGKGEPRWQSPTPGALFLGIDHTALVVADTRASLRFYRDRLGLRVAGESENRGPEQERLNAVAGARLRITTLRARGGPGIELLEYLAPRDGRPYPADARPNDLLHWHTTLAVEDIEQAAGALREAGAAFVSPGPVRLPPSGLGFAQGLIARDPDGHALQLVR